MRDDGTLYYPFGSKTVEVKEIKDNRIVVNTDDENRYRGIIADGVGPTSPICNRYAEEVVNAAKNSGLDPKAEVRKFYHANFPDLDEDQLSYLVITFFSPNREPDRIDKSEIREKGVEAIYGNGGGNIITEGGQDENNSIRR